MRLIFLVSTVLAAVPSSIAADQPLAATPGGYHAGLTKLLRVDSAVPLWGLGIETPAPGGEVIANLSSLHQADRRPTTVAESRATHPRAPEAAPPRSPKENVVPSPGGYQPGLTKLLRVNAHAPVWGPGIETPAPGGEILAPLGRQSLQR